MTWILGIYTQTVYVEEEQGFTHLGQMQTQEDVSGVAQISRYLGVYWGFCSSFSTEICKSDF